MAFTQGAPLPNITQTETRADVAPAYYTDYLTGLSEAAKTAMGRTPAEGIAAYDPLQTQGYGMIPGAAIAYQPGLTAAGQTAATAAGGLRGSRIAELMDPYQKQVVDEMARLQQQNLQQSIMPTLRGAFVGRGDLGSQRYASATGQALANMQRNLTGQQYGALSAGYQNALKAAMEELDIQNRAAAQQANIAKMEQDLGLTGAGALTKGGAERQAYEQAKLDYPLKQATTAAALMRGFQIPTTQTSTFVGPKPGAYQTSPLSNILGVLSVLGGIRPDQKEGASILGKGFEFLKGLPFPEAGTYDFGLPGVTDLGGGSYQTSTGNVIDPSEYSAGAASGGYITKYAMGGLTSIDPMER